MKLIVGLGNVGSKYENTRHNAGFMFLDEFQKVKPDGVFLHKPSTMMNNSGVSVRGLVKKLKIETQDLYVVHDDLDLPLGSFKIQFGRGPKVHNGVNSVEEELGSGGFWRIRIGVDSRDTLSRAPGEKYVLEDFSSTEEETLMKTIKNATAELLVKLQNAG